jgi:predicted phosphodiesterase
VRIAIFSDVHGNLTALEAVLADIDRQAPDLVLFAGDLCLFGPRPAACLELVRQRGISSVYGNTDEWVNNPPMPPAGAAEREQQHLEHLNDISLWTQSQLNDDALLWLAALPFEQRVSATVEAADDLLMVHANPRDVGRVIFPTEAKQVELFGETQHKQADEELAPLLEGTSAAVLAYGHLHVPNIRQWREMTLANISSVSLPGDRDPRAKYGLLNWDRGQGWRVEHRYIPYEMSQEVDALERLKPPKWESYARRLEKAGG